MSEQASYQVRFDWGAAGEAAISPGADAVIRVDQLGGAADARGLEHAEELADWAIARQEELGGRFTVAVIATGAERADGGIRFAVEDLLAAGAIIEAIAARGIDHQSPEAAAAASAYRGLQRATRHLIAASVSARELRSG